MSVTFLPRGREAITETWKTLVQNTSLSTGLCSRRGEPGGAGRARLVTEGGTSGLMLIWALLVSTLGHHGASTKINFANSFLDP